MLVIDNKATADDYSTELTLESAFGGRLVYVVANQSAIARFRPLLERGGSGVAEYGPEVLLTPQSSVIDRISAVRFRSAVAGTPGRIVAQLSEPGDILPAAGTPFTGTLSASGGLTPPTAGGVASYIKVTRAAVQAIGAAVYTTLVFDTVAAELDPNNDLSLVGGDVVVATAGLYLVTLTSSLSASPGVEAIAGIFSPAATELARNDSSGVNAIINSVGVLVVAAAGDAIRGKVYSANAVNDTPTMTVAKLA